MAKLAAGLASLVVVVCTATLTAPAATGCTFVGAKWQTDGKRGTRYAVTVLRGIACSLFAITSLIAGQVTVLKAPWARLAVRISGSWIAAVGMLMFGWSMRG